MSSAAAEPQLSLPADVVQAALKQYWGFDRLRPLQSEAIAAALAGRDSLVVMPTGGGKSLCYQLPPLASDSVDVVVSPLIALMKDQVDGLLESGYRAAALHSGMNAAERRATQAELLAGNLRLLFVAPERLLTDEFMETLHAVGVRRFAIDEAHCVSQWGHDFRKDYRQLATLRERFPDASVHAFTATATPRVRRDIVEQLGLRDPVELVGVFDRPNLVYRILPKVDAQRQTYEAVMRHPDEAVIVYCISRRETESMAGFLCAKGVKAAHYHAGMTPEDRRKTQEDFSNERVDVVAATVAFGMGIDRSNVRCVVHASLPKSLEHYQQETGRAGRDGLEAECVLLYSGGDASTWESILRSSAAEADQPDDVFAAQMELLRRMRAACTAGVCRHKAISEYFGQAYERQNCAACDVCLSEVEFLPDSNLTAQKILSCVYRVGQRFGVSHVVDVLLGAETETIRVLNHNELSTYGLLKEFGRKQLQALVHQLVDSGALTRSVGDRPTLSLNAESWAILKGHRQARLVRPIAKVAKRTAKATADRTGMDEGLFERLRHWRRTLAAERSVPPYIILADTSLVELAKRRPASLESLREIPGIGAKRALDFGSALLEEIGSYSQTNSPRVEESLATSAKPGAAKAKEVRQAAYELFAASIPLDDVAKSLGRARSTVFEYLVGYLELHPETSLDPYVEPSLQSLVRAALAECGCPPLRPVFEKLAGAATFADIKLVAAKMRACGEDLRLGQPLEPTG